VIKAEDLIMVATIITTIIIEIKATTLGIIITTTTIIITSGITIIIKEVVDIAMVEEIREEEDTIMEEEVIIMVSEIIISFLTIVKEGIMEVVEEEEEMEEVMAMVLEEEEVGETMGSPIISLSPDQSHRDLIGNLLHPTTRIHSKEETFRMEAMELEHRSLAALLLLSVFQRISVMTMVYRSSMILKHTHLDQSSEYHSRAAQIQVYLTWGCVVVIHCMKIPGHLA